MSNLKNLLLLSPCISCALLYSVFETFLLTLMLKKIWLIFICTEVHRPLNTHLTSWSFGGFPRVFFIWLLGSFESRICRQSCFKLLLFVIFNYVKNSVLTQSRFLFCWWELVIITKLLFFDKSIIYGLRSYFFFSFYGARFSCRCHLLIFLTIFDTVCSLLQCPHQKSFTFNCLT